MKLRNQILIILSAIMLVFMVLIIFSIDAIVDNYHQSMIEEMNKNISNTIEFTLDLEKRNLESIIIGHAVWTEFKDKLAVGDVEWIEENATSYILEESALNVDMMYVSSTVNGYKTLNGPFDEDQIMTFDIMKAIESSDGVHFQYKKQGHNLYVLAGSKIMDNNYENGEGVYILGTVIENEEIKSVFNLLEYQDVALIELEDTSAIHEPDEDVYGFLYELKGDDGISVHVEYTLTELDQMIQMTYWHILTVLLIASTLFIIFVFIFTNRIAKRIESSIDSIDHIAEGNYHKKLEGGGSLEVNKLFDSINKLAGDLHATIESLEQSYIEAISLMVKTLEMTDYYTKGHSERVSKYAEGLAKHIGYEDVETIRISALMHDIGKVTVSESILNKAGKLTDEEFALIKKHPEIGYEILDTANVFEKAKFIILYHHERYDGSGYPKGLKGGEIPKGAMIISIVDVFDAITSNRSYRNAMDLEKAIGIIRSERATHFDPDICDAFLEIVYDLYEEFGNVE